MKITYSKSEPWHSGWRGWSDAVDVFLDGEKIGQLIGDADNKKFLEYGFVGDRQLYVNAFGIRAAKKQLEEALAEEAAAAPL